MRETDEQYLLADGESVLRNVAWYAEELDTLIHDWRNRFPETAVPLPWEEVYDDLASAADTVERHQRNARST